MHINMDKIILTPSTQHTTYYAGTATYTTLIYLIKLIAAYAALLSLRLLRRVACYKVLRWVLLLVTI